MWNFRILAHYVNQSSCTRLVHLSSRNFKRPIPLQLLQNEDKKSPIILNTARRMGRFTHGSDASNNDSKEMLSLNWYEKVSEETLETLGDQIDKVLEENYKYEFDVSLSNGVLTVQLANHGTYVINKQTPNRQIWLSSPKSGPKRYDFVEGSWIYSHDSISLYDLLSRELSNILNQDVSLVPLVE